jgi:DNA-binding Lrp family transcriptional regulator
VGLTASEGKNPRNTPKELPRGFFCGTAWRKKSDLFQKRENPEHSIKVTGVFNNRFTKNPQNLPQNTNSYSFVKVFHEPEMVNMKKKSNPFLRIDTKLAERRDLNSTEKMIIGCLCGVENLFQNGQIRITATQIAKKVGKSLRWVKECIKHLKEKGLILVKRGRYCIYAIVHKSAPLKNPTFYNKEIDGGAAAPDADNHPNLNEVMQKIPFKSKISRKMVNNWLIKNNGNRSYLFWLVRISAKKRNPMKYFMKGLKKYYAAYLRSEEYQVACAISEFKNLDPI